MKKGSFIFLLLAANLSLTALADNFIACKSTYALCTTAPCVPIPGKKGFVSCKCSVNTGYSVGTKSCKKIQNTSKGQITYSRYYPIKSYATCSNNRPWAWCLDSPCIIDKKDPTQASCLCSVVKNKGPYIIVTNTYDQSTCTTGLYSSALVSQSKQITDFLKTQSVLPPFPIKVLNSNN